MQKGRKHCAKLVSTKARRYDQYKVYTRKYWWWEKCPNSKVSIFQERYVGNERDSGNGGMQWRIILSVLKICKHQLRRRQIRFWNPIGLRKLKRTFELVVCSQKTKILFKIEEQQNPNCSWRWVDTYLPERDLEHNEAWFECEVLNTFRTAELYQGARQMVI